MLNPSTADAIKDDPTIKKCIKFARREGCGSLEVVNLFSYRATDPQELSKLTFGEAVGPLSGNPIAEALCRCDLVIAAWGANVPFPSVVDDVHQMSAMREKKLWCFQITKHGHPKHPLYVRDDQPLIEFSYKAIAARNEGKV
jgi:hypothetical protein